MINKQGQYLLTFVVYFFHLYIPHPLSKAIRPHNFQSAYKKRFKVSIYIYFLYSFSITLASPYLAGRYVTYICSIHQKITSLCSIVFYLWIFWYIIPRIIWTLQAQLPSQIPRYNWIRFASTPDIISINKKANTDVYTCKTGKFGSYRYINRLFFSRKLVSNT